MSFFQKILGSSSGNAAEVTANNRLKVDLETNAETYPAQVGAVRTFSECDAGGSTGTPLLLSPETSLDYRLRVGSDTVLFNDVFNGNAQNTALWYHVFATMTCVQPGAGTLNFGAVQGTTSSHGAVMRTWQYFPVIGTAPMAVEIGFGQYVANMVAGEVFLCGIGLPGSAILEPTDGLFLRLTNAGLAGEIRYNGVTTSTGIIAALSDFPVGDLSNCIIVFSQKTAQFWQDDVLIGSLEMPAANGQPFQGGALPVFLMKYNTGAVSNTNQIRVSSVNVTIEDIQTFKPWAHQMAASGLMAYQGQNGGTMGTTASLPNASAATTITGGAISQTVAIKTGLGGEAGIQANVAGADGIVTAFQVPVGSVTQTPRNLIITGIRVDSVNVGAAVATTASILQWSLAYGAIFSSGTIPPLTQAENASFANSTAKAYRRVALGIQSWLVGAAIGQPAEQITLQFESPIVVQPGQWVATTAKFLVGTATANQVAWANITFDAHYE